MVVTITTRATLVHILMATLQWHAVHHPAQAVEIVDVGFKPITGRLYGVGLEGGELDAVLVEDIHDRDLAAEGIAPAVGSHFVEVVRIGLDEERPATPFG